MSIPTLREQHAEATRARILSAVAELVEAGEPEDVTMASVAARSGVSLRTVYRYYPTRELLLEAAGRWIGEEVLRHRVYPQSLDDVADVIEAGTREFGERPGLVRALAVSQLGRDVRGYRRRERLDAIREALRTEVGGLPEDELRRAEAILAYLHNILAYTTLRDESSLDDDEIGKAIGWAIRTLVDDLRRRHETRGST